MIVDVTYDLQYQEEPYDIIAAVLNIFNETLCIPACFIIQDELDQSLFMKSAIQYGRSFTKNVMLRKIDFYCK